VRAFGLHLFAPFGVGLKLFGRGLFFFFPRGQFFGRAKQSIFAGINPPFQVSGSRIPPF